MPLNQVHYRNGTGVPVTFTLKLHGPGGPQTLPARTVPPGAPTRSYPVNPAWNIDTVLSTSDIQGLPNRLVLVSTVTDPGLVEATAEAHTPTHGRLTTVGGSNPSADYLPGVPATRSVPPTPPDEKQRPQAST